MFTRRGPSGPSPHIEADGKFVSARTIRSAWPWCDKLGLRGNAFVNPQIILKFSSLEYYAKLL